MAKKGTFRQLQLSLATGVVKRIDLERRRCQLRRPLKAELVAIRLSARFSPSQQHFCVKTPLRFRSIAAIFYRPVIDRHVFRGNP
jgi:hypothetical protein